MLSQPRPISLLDTAVQLSGVATNVVLAARVLKPALDYFLIPSDSPVSSLKGLHTATPLVRTTKLTPPLQPSCGLIFGMGVCFLSLVVAGSLLVRTHAGSQSPDPSSSETLAYNPEQRQGQDRREAPRRSGRGPPNPIPPNNNRNNIPIEDMKHHRPYKRPHPRGDIGAPPPPPPPPPPPAAAAVHPDKAGRKAGGNTLWKSLFGLSLMALFVKYTSTSDRYCSHADDILVDSDDTSSMPPDFLGPMEQNSAVALRNPLGPLLAWFQVVHEAICHFIPTFFTSPCLFFRLVVDYLICTLLCWILSIICTLASGSTTIRQVKEDKIIQVESGLLNEQDIPQLPCEDIPTQLDQLEDLGNSEQFSGAQNAAEDMVVSVSDAPNLAEDVVVPEAPNPAEDMVVPDAPNPAENMVVSLASEPDGGLSAELSTQPVEKRFLPPGRTRRTRPRRHPNRPRQNHTSGPDHA